MNTALTDLTLPTGPISSALPLAPTFTSEAARVPVQALASPLGVRLSALPTGTAGRIALVTLEGVLGDRLVELGFTAGAPIRVLRKAPFGGPLQVQIRDFVLSLRRDDASCIHVAAGLA
jgi:ferrous iron transport protein A